MKKCAVAVSENANVWKLIEVVAPSPVEAVKMIRRGEFSDEDVTIVNEEVLSYEIAYVEVDDEMIESKAIVNAGK